MSSQSLSHVMVPAINHLLAQEPWATQQLQTHAAKIACIDFSAFSLRMKITSAGFLESAPDDVTPNVTIRINLADIPLILHNRERAVSYVKLDGDADLAQTISELGKNLRLDAEHELSKLFGDILGRRLALAGKDALASLQNGFQKLTENGAEYFLEENPLLVRPERVEEFSVEVGRMRDDVERLEKRIEKYEKALRNVQ